MSAARRITRLAAPALLVLVSAARLAAAQQSAGAHGVRHAIAVTQIAFWVVGFSQRTSNPATSSRAGRSGSNGAGQRPSAFTVKVGEISHELAVWMKEAVDNGRQSTTRPVEILSFNPGGQMTVEQSMSKAEVAHIILPAVGTMNRNSADLSLELQSATVTRGGSANNIRMPPTDHPMWKRSDYHVSFARISVGQFVTRIDAIDIAPGADCPGLTMVVGEADIAKAQNALDAHTTTSGELDYLALDRKTVVVRVQFTGLRVDQVDKHAATKTSPQGTAQVRFTCTGVALDFPGKT